MILGGLGETGDQCVSLGRLWGAFGGDFGRLLGDSGRLWGGFGEEEEKKRRREGKRRGEKFVRPSEQIIHAFTS